MVRPMAFEWIGSTYLPKLWEQMTAAYEFGVQEIWVTNIGDIGPRNTVFPFSWIWHMILVNGAEGMQRLQKNIRRNG